VVLTVGVEDSTGESTPYIEVDGVSETIDLLKPVVTTGPVTVGTNIELGHASENTLSASGGVLSIEGVALLPNAANTIDSDQYVDGSIDLIHLSTDSVDYTKTTGSFKALTPVNDSAANFAANFTGVNLYGGTFLCSTTGTIQLPAVAAGMSFTIITVGAIAVSVDTNASDLMMLDGVALDDGDKATNTSTAGDIIVFQYMDATGWVATSNGWTDGGA
jgi:hypothetical protein